MKMSKKRWLARPLSDRIIKMKKKGRERGRERERRGKEERKKKKRKGDYEN